MDKLMSLAVILAIPVFLLASWLANTKSVGKSDRGNKADKGAPAEQNSGAESKLSDNDMTSP